jgi:hypothetical protein
MVISAAGLAAFSNATPTKPDHFTAKPFSLLFTVTDDQSHTSGTMTYAGLLSGTLTKNLATLSATFIGPTTQRLHLGHHWYSVTVGPFQDPVLGKNPAQGLLGGISARVSVQNNPEPSSAVLAVLGLAGLGISRWRRGLTRKAAAAV